jgi:hypothetical protein
MATARSAPMNICTIERRFRYLDEKEKCIKDYYSPKLNLANPSFTTDFRIKKQIQTIKNNLPISPLSY